ncbi:cation-translocating P-type ATPase [Desulfocastanea catecholica]
MHPLHSPTQEPKPIWHALPISELLTLLVTSENGLTGAEVNNRLEYYGRNRFPQKPPAAWWVILLRQFMSPLIYILAIAAIVSAVVHPDAPADALFIVAVLVLNAAIGGYQEAKAEQKSHALLQLLQIKASVLRDGEVREVDADEVVPGDIVWLESGNRIPADMRLLMTHGLEVDESLLTGESLPVTKESLWIGEESTPVADHRNMAYAGSIIIHGRAKGVVVATGPATVVGQLAVDVMSAEGGKPPLLLRMEKFTRVIGASVLFAAVVIAAVGILFRGYSLNDMFLFSVALAVSAIPEGLPVALTVALAIATTRMARRGVIVRRLAAVEGLGSCTLIGSDKTGTLTCNELTVRSISLPDGQFLEVTGEGFIPDGEVLFDAQAVVADAWTELHDLAVAAVLCNEAVLHQRDGSWSWRGDPTDIALLAMAHKIGVFRETALSRYPQVNEIPFEPERRYAATFHQDQDQGAGCLFVKGAPERVLAMCDFPGQAAAARKLRARAASLADQGFRVLALAKGLVEEDFDASQAPPEPEGLVFLGFVGMIDPLRPGVQKAVAECRLAGITVNMITGDHPGTAFAIARDLGFAHRPEQVITGRELEEMAPEQLAEAVQHGRVFARVTPRQKLELVEAARNIGHYVAVTGDGVNDAPALRQANIGVAMGMSGTDVAREAADLVITDDNFATIVAGIEEGRIAYDNVRKVIYLLVSTGAAEVILLGLVVMTGWPRIHADQALLPLLPAQLLWLNLVTNGIQDVALAFEPGEAGVLQRPPRPTRERVFNRLMIERTIVAALVIAGVSFAAFFWMIEIGGWSEGQARNGLLMLMVLFEIIHIGNCRSETTSGLRLSPLKSPILLVGTVLAFLVHMIAMHIPFMQNILGIEPINFVTFAALLGLALTIFAAMEMHKWWWNIRHKNEKKNDPAYDLACCSASSAIL